MKGIIRLLLKLRLALVSIATEESTCAVDWHERRLETLARKEINLRTQLSRVHKIRASIIYPEISL